MKILEGQMADAIEPFPVNQIHRAVGWLHCYKTLTITDDDPQDPQGLEGWFAGHLARPIVRSWGIIDKFNRLNIRHEAPLVGFGIFDRTQYRNGYFHVATTRKAWGSGLTNDIGRVILREVFTSTPELTRVSGMILTSNAPAIEFSKRMGFVPEGVLRNYCIQNHTLRNVMHLGLTREAWEHLETKHTKSQPEVEEVTA